MLVIFAAVRPATGEDLALVLPELSTVAMAILLEGFAGALPAHTRRYHAPSANKKACSLPRSTRQARRSVR